MNLPKYIKTRFVKIDKEKHQLICTVNLDPEVIKFLAHFAKFMNKNHELLRKIIDKYDIDSLMYFIKLALEEGFLKQ